jgi:hypothetical protein
MNTHDSTTEPYFKTWAKAEKPPVFASQLAGIIDMYYYARLWLSSHFLWLQDLEKIIEVLCVSIFLPAK